MNKSSGVRCLWIQVQSALYMASRMTFKSTRQFLLLLCPGYPVGSPSTEINPNACRRGRGGGRWQMPRRLPLHLHVFTALSPRAQPQALCADSPSYLLFPPPDCPAAHCLNAGVPSSEGPSVAHRSTKAAPLTPPRDPPLSCSVFL